MLKTNQLSKTIIYDFDGTIADSFNAAIEVYNRIAQEKGFKSVNENNKEFLQGIDPRQVLKELGVSLYQVPGLLFRARKDFKRWIPNLQAHAGIQDLLNQLKNLGYRQAILTSNSEENVKAFLQKNNIDPFDFIYSGSSAFGKGKILKNLITDKGLDPQQIIYIGDEIRDIEAARKAKVKIISVDWGFSNTVGLQKNNPDMLVHKPSELLQAILTIN